MYCTSAVMRAASARRVRSSSRARAVAASGLIDAAGGASTLSDTATSSFMTQGLPDRGARRAGYWQDEWRAAAFGSFCSASGPQPNAGALADRLVGAPEAVRLGSRSGAKPPYIAQPGTAIRRPRL